MGMAMTHSGKDAIYAQARKQIEDFRFDQSVAEVFPDMIQRSVPGYDTIVDSIGQLSGQHAQAGSTLYDLGCSLGAATLAMQKYVRQQDCSIVAVDNSEAMIERCKLHLGAFRCPVPVDVVCDDLQNVRIENASVVVLNFTLQFIVPEERQAIIDTIYAGMLPGGILIISEKIAHPSEAGNKLLIDLHHEFKRRNGYSDLEISQKRTALENVMRTDSFAVHESRFKQAGFRDAVLWFKCYNFASMVAIK